MAREKKAPLAEDVIALVESGTAAWVATCGASGAPEATRVMGARASRETASMTLYLPVDQAGLTLENLRANPRLAAFFVWVLDYRAVQVKGTVIEIRPTDAEDREHQARYARELTDACAQVGIPRAAMAAVRCWPSVAVEMTADEIFVQTPGPNAGNPWR
jgi:hypothetical protein